MFFLSPAPTNILLYTLADSGLVGFYDPDATNNGGDIYLVGRSLRPVAVTYDPKNQVRSSVPTRLPYYCFFFIR